MPKQIPPTKKNRNRYTTAHQGLRDHEDKNNASIMAVISVVLLECALAPESAR